MLTAAKADLQPDLAGVAGKCGGGIGRVIEAQTRQRFGEQQALARPQGLAALAPV